MAEPVTPAPSPARFRLTVRPPVRALVIGSVPTLLGALLIAVAGWFRWPTGWQSLGLVLMAIGIALVGVALYLTKRLQSTVLLDETMITVVRGRRRRSLRWSEITEVVQRGPRLVLVTKPGGDDLVIVQPEPSSLVTQRLNQAIHDHLDRDRGYGRMP